MSSRQCEFYWWCFLRAQKHSDEYPWMCLCQSSAAFISCCDNIKMCRHFIRFIRTFLIKRRAKERRWRLLLSLFCKIKFRGDTGVQPSAHHTMGWNLMTRLPIVSIGSLVIGLYWMWQSQISFNHLLRFFMFMFWYFFKGLPLSKYFYGPFPHMDTWKKCHWYV